MTLNFSIAFMAGLFSFLSPCVLPLIPAYLALITGLTAKELEEGDRRYFLDMLIESILFIVGFSTVFISFSIIINYFGRYIPKKFLSLIGGIIIILLGLHLLGVLPIKILHRAKRIHLSSESIYIGSSLVVGMIFGLGWTPCVGPILGSILMFASVQETVNRSISLLIFYSLGLGVPFLLVSLLGVGLFVRFLKKFRRFYKIVEIISGCLLIIVGVLMLFNKFWIV